MSSSAPRVATLLPSATEIVCALGLGEQLVGVSHECDFPPEAVGRTVLTSTKVLPRARSAEIDRDVRAVLRDALAVYDIDLEALARAAPDVIVTQDLCDVCAVSFSAVEEAVRTLAKPKTRVVNLHPTRLAEILDDIERVGRELGAPARAAALLGDLRARMDRVRARAADIPRRPSVLTIEWLDPVMVGGTWMPELVELAGGAALVTTPGERAPTLALQQLVRLRPEVVLVKPCGFALERTRAERDVLARLVQATDWPARRRGAVWLADGNAFFNRPGPRIADSLEILAACVHPREFADLAEQHAGSFERFET